MELFLKIATTLLLLVHTFHPVLLQEESTDSPGRTIKPEWFRQLGPKKNVDPQPSESANNDPLAEENAVESGGSGIASGSMWYMEEENGNETLEYPTQPPTFPNETTVQPEIQDSNVSTTTQVPQSKENVTDVDKENSTAVPESFTTNVMLQNSTAPNDFNSTDVQTTTSAPEKNATETTTVDSGLGFTNETESNGTTTAAAPIPEVTEQETTTSSTANPSTTTTRSTTITTTTAPKESSTTLLEATTSVPATPDRANLSDKGGASGGTAERGFADSDSGHKRRKSAWGAVLGTFVAVAFVGMVAYVILKRKHHKAFSHRKLEEEFPSDPVLRLDNSEPLDLNFGRAAYYNPGLQGDNIQMSNFPKH